MVNDIRLKGLYLQDIEQMYFPKDSLDFSDANLDVQKLLLEAILAELSTVLPGWFVLHHEIAWAVQGSLDKDDFNDTEYEDIIEIIPALVNDVCDLIFATRVAHGQFALTDINDDMVKISFRKFNKENF